MITLHQLFEHYGVHPTQLKLVRHSDKELPILETYQNNIKKFEAYQSFQRFGKFSDATHIAVFASSRGTTALFLGLWQIKGIINCTEYTKKMHSTIDKYDFPKSWHTDHAWYKLVRDIVADELSERLVIEWGKSTVAWVQSKDKEILEIKCKNSIGDFESYDKVQLNYYDLKKLILQKSSNFSWITALSSVNGIYLIRDKNSGNLYVGSAYGEEGILGRWSNYAQNGHGNNKNLKSLEPKNFEFSILEITPQSLSDDEIIRREMRWQEKLGTRDFGGLNSK